MARAGDAAEHFRNGANCSQAVFGAFAEEHGIELDSALRIASGFGGGMGRMGYTCGAVTGGIMAIGAVQSGPDPLTPASKVSSYGLVQSFLEEFAARNGSTVCCELLGCNISTPEGYEQADRLELFRSRCPKYVEDAVEILEELL